MAKPVKDTPFVEERRLGRIEILGTSIAQITTTESNEAPTFIVDRKHHTPTEWFVAILLEQPRLP
jgi:hypothetical protein